MLHHEHLSIFSLLVPLHMCVRGSASPAETSIPLPRFSTISVTRPTLDEAETFSQTNKHS